MGSNPGSREEERERERDNLRGSPLLEGPKTCISESSKPASNRER